MISTKSLIIYAAILVTTTAFAAGKKPKTETSCAAPPTVIRVLPLLGEHEFTLPDGQIHDLDVEFMQQFLTKIELQRAQTPGARIIQLMTETQQAARAFGIAEDLPPEFWWESSILPAADLQVEVQGIEWKKGASVRWNIPLIGHLFYETLSLRMRGGYQLGNTRREFSVKKSGFEFDAGAYIPTQAGSFEIEIQLKRKGLMMRVLREVLQSMAQDVISQSKGLPSLLRVDQIVGKDLLLGGTTGLNEKERCGWNGKELELYVNSFGEKVQSNETLFVKRSTLSGQVGAIKSSNSSALEDYLGTIWIWNPH